MKPQESQNAVQRLDFGRISQIERTPQGGLKCPANLTRTGVFVYTRADGSIVRELRHPEEVFSEDSIRTLAGAPVTDLHPDQPVRPSNWKTTAVGHVAEAVKQDGKFVSAALLIQDGETITRIDRGERKELSCGYTCALEHTAGEYDGEKYDAIQRGIVYNHVALGPENWGRAGTEVALRLDSSGNQTFTAAKSPPDQKTEGEKMPDQKYTIDGVTYDTASPEFLQALAIRDKRSDAEREKLTAERDALRKERDDAAKELAAANDPARLDSLVSARVALVDGARKMIGNEARFDGKTDREIMIEAITHNDSAFDANGKSNEYVAAYFEATSKNARRHDEGGNGIAAARSAVVVESSATREDNNTAEAARRRMLESNNNAATQPLRFSRKN